MIHRCLNDSLLTKLFCATTALFSALCVAPLGARGQSTGAEKDSDVTRQMSSAFESLVKRRLSRGCGGARDRLRLRGRG